MHARVLAVLGVAILAACQRDAARVGERDTSAVEATAPARLDLFAEAPSAGALLVFVGRDSTILPGERANAVFVPFSTFSVERDGIPNEFPAADSMAAMLRAAGVAGDNFLIVGEPIPAGRAFAAFDYLGLADRTALLDGGVGALASAPPATGAAPSDGEWAIDVRRDMIVDAQWVHDRMNDSGVAILDARPPAEFSGKTPGDGVNRPGHIPGARNVFWQTLVRSPDDARLKDEAELRRMFEEAGAAPGDTVVAYCRTGGQASFLYTVARHLGYDVRLYDGSYVDWSRTEYPVER
jgi:thiosulfate/3-mercaptopyruvate sulfurtransferase